MELISGLKMKIQQDGKAEQALYDKSLRLRYDYLSCPKKEKVSIL